MHSFPIRVYYEDTDAGGVVYYANYLKFAERARTEMLRYAGIEQAKLMAEHNIAFVVRACDTQFLRPARLDDLLTIQTRLHDSGAARLTLSQTILREGETLVTLGLRIGVVKAGADGVFRATRLPESTREILNRLTEPTTEPLTT